jgi:hypothetical protein
MGDSFRVMAFNAWLSGDRAYWTDKGKDKHVGASVALQKMASLLSAHAQGKPTLVGLQEMTSALIGGGRTQELDDFMGSGWGHEYLPLLLRGSGTYGIANLYNVPKYKEQEWLYMYDSDYKTDWGNEQRGANLTKHDFGGGHVVWFINTHLEGSDKVGMIALRQAFELLGQLKRLAPDHPQIVVGDFNIYSGFPGPYAALLKLFNDPMLSGLELVQRHRRMYIFKYDPHGQLILRSHQAMDPVYGGATLSDHHLLVAEFEWK